MKDNDNNEVKIIIKNIVIFIFISGIIIVALIYGIIQDYKDRESKIKASNQININAPEWINLQKQILKKYPKIKEVELYGNYTLGIGYITDGKISEDDTEKIFEETREVVLKSDIYQILQKESLKQSADFRIISIGFESLKSDGDTKEYASFDSSCEDNTKRDRSNDSQSYESEIASYRYAFTTWKITYNDKKYEKYIPVK